MGLDAFTAGAWVPSLVGELGSLKLDNAAKKPNKQTKMSCKKKKRKTQNAGEDMEPQKLFIIASGNAKWYSHFGRLYGYFLQK